MMKSAITILSLLVFFNLLVACGSSEDNKVESKKEQSKSDSTDLGESNNEQDERLSPADTVKLALGNWKISVSYGSPAVRDREIWGSLVSYDRVWRTGANEATTFYTNKDVEILGNILPAGRYGFFTIPGKDSWTVIFNKVWNQWGAYEYNENEDVLRVIVQPEQLNTFSERLSFDLKPNNDAKVTLHFYWEKLHFTLPIEMSE